VGLTHNVGRSHHLRPAPSNLKMNKPNPDSKIKRWIGVVTEFDRYLAGLDPRQMHFSFYTEPRPSEQESSERELRAETFALLVSAA
jgi:hypothetical protein